MRRIAIFFLICPEERSIIAESGLIAGFCDGGAPAQELVCVLEAFFGQVFGNGVAGFLAEETHHVVFAYVKAGGELVDRMVFFCVYYSWNLWYTSIAPPPKTIGNTFRPPLPAKKSWNSCATSLNTRSHNCCHQGIQS